MPKYHFHITNKRRHLDEDGTVLPDLASAREQAVMFAASVLRDSPEIVWDEGDWRVEVTTTDGRLLFSIIVLAIEGPQFNGRE